MTSHREGLRKKANYQHFVDKRLTPPLSTSAEGIFLSTLVDPPPSALIHWYQYK